MVLRDTGHTFCYWWIPVLSMTRIPPLEGKKDPTPTPIPTLPQTPHPTPHTPTPISSPHPTTTHPQSFIRPATLLPNILVGNGFTPVKYLYINTLITMFHPGCFCWQCSRQQIKSQLRKLVSNGMDFSTHTSTHKHTRLLYLNRVLTSFTELFGNGQISMCSWNMT